MGNAATLFAGEGASVVVADVTDEAGQAAVEQIGGAGGSAAYFHADVSSHTDAEAMVGFTVERFGGLQVLYNNAGIFPADDGSVTDTPEATWDRVIRHQPQGRVPGVPVRHTGDARLRRRLDHQRRIVRGSDGGQPLPRSLTRPARGGVLSMTRAIAIEFARKNIRANALCPGPIEHPQGSSSPTGSCGATSNASSLIRVTIRRCSEGVQACHR